MCICAHVFPEKKKESHAWEKYFMYVKWINKKREVQKKSHPRVAPPAGVFSPAVELAQRVEVHTEIVQQQPLVADICSRLCRRAPRVGKANMAVYAR